MNVSGALGSATATSSRGGASANALMASTCRMARTEILINRLMVQSLPDPTGPARPAFLLRRVANRAAAQPNPPSTSHRFVKKQQMRCQPATAYLLLQVRTRTLNDSMARFARYLNAGGRDDAGLSAGFVLVPIRKT